MKSNELRIGNKLFIGGGLKEDCVVLSISDKLIGYETETRKGKCNIEWLNAMPLNQYWLFKFGFKTRTTESISVQYFIGENPITRDWLFDILWIEGDECPFYRNGFFKIKYVHELQNLYFALTGTELAYENETK